MIRFYPILLCLLSCSFVSAFVDPMAMPEVLTADDYDEKTAGKTIFVKFFSPKCKACIAMAPIWESLSKQFGSKGHALIAAVDCSNEKNRELCVKNKISHMPALLWGDPQNLEPYTGGPEFEEVYRFARKNLRPSCSANPRRRHMCTTEQNATIAEYEIMLEGGTLDDKIKELEDRMEEIRDTFTSEVIILNELANEFNDAKIAATTNVEVSLQLLKSERGRRHILATFDKYEMDKESGTYVLKSEKSIEASQSNETGTDEL
jgi:thiol-disulfide isomerase/thioredoxin